MKDLDEGLDFEGLIVTGVAGAKVPIKFRPVLDDLVGLAGANVSVYVYGSVATGRARVGHSDVDIVTLGMDASHAKHVSRELSMRYADLAREVAIGAWSAADLTEGDAGYGNQAFLKHYCAWLAGPDPAAALPRFRGDVAAARGFNGDFPAMAVRWAHTLAALDPGAAYPMRLLARRIGRKTLFAVSSLVSVHDRVWTTDRAASAERWGQLHPTLDEDLSSLIAWGDETTSPAYDEVARVLQTSVTTLVDQFSSDIGAWKATA